MICTFFGHRDVSEGIRDRLYLLICNLIEKDSIYEFVVGNNGSYDYIVQTVLKELKRAYPQIKYSIVLSRLDEKALTENQERTVYPSELAYSLPKFSISKRNDWLLKKASVVIVYVKKKYSNSYKLAERAKRRGSRVINIADI